MTDDVAALVLRDNYFQTQALSVTGRIAPRLLDAQQRFIRFLEKQGRLNRAIEFLPTDDEIAERRAKAFGAHQPRARGAARLQQDVALRRAARVRPARRSVGRHRARALLSHRRCRKSSAAYIARHPLKREIIATHVINSMVNRVGSTFVHRLMETTGATPDEIVRAYLLTREIFGFVPLWQAIEALDNIVRRAAVADADRARAPHRARDRRGSCARAGSPSRWPQRSSDLRRRQPHCCSSLLRRRPARRGVHRSRNTSQALVAKGVPPPLALAVAASDTSFAALDIAEVAESSKQPLTVVANTYFSIGELLGLATASYASFRAARRTVTGRAWPKTRWVTTWRLCSASSPPMHCRPAGKAHGKWHSVPRSSVLSEC